MTEEIERLVDDFERIGRDFAGSSEDKSPVLVRLRKRMAEAGQQLLETIEAGQISSPANLKLYPWLRHSRDSEDYPRFIELEPNFFHHGIQYFPGKDDDATRKMKQSELKPVPFNLKEIFANEKGASFEQLVGFLFRQYLRLEKEYKGEDLTSFRERHVFLEAVARRLSQKDPKDRNRVPKLREWKVCSDRDGSETLLSDCDVLSGYDVLLDCDNSYENARILAEVCKDYCWLLNRELRAGAPQEKSDGAKKAGLSKEEIALGILANDPGIKVTELAKRVGVSRTSIYDMPKVKKSIAILKETGRRSRKQEGFKNESTGEINTWDTDRK